MMCLYYTVNCDYVNVKIVNTVHKIKYIVLNWHGFYIF